MIMFKDGKTRSSLLRRAAQGDAEEFAELYRCLAYGMARKCGLDHNDAEDVAQQTVVQLWELLPRFVYDRSRGRFRGLVKKVVRNRVADLLRRWTPTVPPEALAAWPVNDDQLDAIFEKEWEKTHLLAALDMVRTRVKPSTFQAFQLYALNRWPMDKVTRTLNLSRDQVYQNKRRVIELVRQYFGKLQREEA